MTKIKKYSGKALGIILSLLMILTVIPSLSLTAFAAPTETLLTKITPTGTNTYSESVAGVVTVTLSNISRYSSSSGWAYGGTVTVAPVEGYTITKCRFNVRVGYVDDTEAPFSIDVGSATYVRSVEVYGYQAPSSSYIDGSGESQTVNATELAASTTSWTNGSWYIVPEGGLTISGRITVNGTVNLILRDGATLTASAGITTTGATLNIYAQSAGTGTLTAKGSNGNRNSTGGSAGIGGCGGAYEENGGAGGTVSIFGGTVTATGGNSVGGGAGAGIGGGGAGLGRGQTGGAGGTVSIFGGTVTATGGDSEDGGAGAGIGGGGKEMRGSDGASGTLTLGKGVKLYSGTNNSGTVLDGSDSTARSYSGSRPQKMFAELYTGPNKTDLNTAITAAETLYNSIKDDTNYSTIASTLKTAIDAAKAVADSETADQDAVDAAKTAITTAKTNAEAAKKDVDDTNAANAVITKINALPAADDVTTANKEAIEAARAAYNALTDDQKKKVDATVLAKLTDAETALQDAIDTETAGAATNTINALPDADEVTTANKDAIEAARKAYNDLTDDQKKKVSDDTLKKLTDAEDALKAAGVSDTINALPAADEVTTANKEAIAAARKAYDDLTDDQKSYVAPETLKKLTDAESALTVAEVNAAIDALPAADEVTTANKEAIAAARKAYDDLTDDQKSYVAPETLKKLTDAESALAVAEVNAAIDALPAADEVTTANKDAIEAARKAYNDLTDDQKAKVSEDTLKKLTDAESAFTVASVSEKINALPDADKVTTVDKEAIEEARGFYDALTDAQKTKVTEDTLKKLTDAEAALKDALDTAAANTASEAINALPEADKVALTDKEAIEAARKAYDELTDDQKAKVEADTLKKLTDAEDTLAVAEKEAADEAAAKDVTDTINALPEADKVATTDKEAIEAARKAYDELTDDQKAKVDADTLKKLTDAEDALAVAEKEAADEAAAKDVTDTINALPEADKVATTDKEAIEAARKAYDELTDDQKAKVEADTLKKLTDAEDTLAVAEKEAADEAAAKDVTDTINALPEADKVATTDKEAIEAARKAYDELTDDQKAKVDADTLKKLTDAEDALAVAEKEAADEAAAKDVTDTINALPEADKVATTDKEAIEAARKAYDELTDDQKAKVEADTLKKLTDAEEALAAAEKKDADDTATANAVSDTINALPEADKVATTDKEAIEAARKAYDKLTDEQKAKVDADTLKKLTDAEEALAAAEQKAAEEQAAKELAAAKKNAQKAMNAQVVVTQKGKKITVKWNKSTAADGYKIYVQYCGKKVKKAVKTIKNNSTTKLTLTKLNGKKLNLKKQFKVYVKAYKIVNGKKKTLAKSIVGHIVGVKNKKFTNVKSIKVTKKALTVKVGKAVKVNAKVTLVNKNKKHIPKSHAAKFRYRTSDKSIATVTKSGKIKGINKGTCTVYVYAINGKMKKVKVTVK